VATCAGEKAARDNHAQSRRSRADCSVEIGRFPSNFREATAMSTGRPIEAPDSFDTTAWITLRWTRGNRYFRAHLEQDLWHS